MDAMGPEVLLAEQGPGHSAIHPPAQGHGHLQISRKPHNISLVFSF
jgi:hypothetical protein